MFTSVFFLPLYTVVCCYAGDWDFHDNHPPDDDEDDAGFDEEEEGYVVIDDDADVDESEVAEDDVDSYNDVILQVQ